MMSVNRAINLVLISMFLMVSIAVLSSNVHAHRGHAYLMIKTVQADVRHDMRLPNLTVSHFSQKKTVFFI